jgi:hypothetical protein
MGNESIDARVFAILFEPPPDRAGSYAKYMRVMIDARAKGSRAFVQIVHQHFALACLCQGSLWRKHQIRR